MVEILPEVTIAHQHRMLVELTNYIILLFFPERLQGIDT